MSEENYDKRVVIGGSAEVSMLSSGLNQFMDSLSTETENLRKAELSLQDNQRQLLMILNSTFHSIFLMDANGYLKEVNQTALDFISSELIDRRSGASFCTNPLVVCGRLRSASHFGSYRQLFENRIYKVRV